MRKNTKPQNPVPSPSTPEQPLPPPPAPCKHAMTDDFDPREQHGFLLTAEVYRHLLKSVVDSDAFAKSALRHMMGVYLEAGPRDPFEQMLLSQMVQTHARLMHLNLMAPQQKNLKWFALMNEAADRAANTFRRQVLALAEYRRPPRPAQSFTAIGQANIAAQQVVQNQNQGNPANENATNEQGCDPGQREAAPALPPDAGGPGGAAAVGGRGPSVGVEHRPSDVRRQGPGADERAAAR